MQSNHRGQRIALELHGLQVNCGNCTPQGGIMTSNPSNLLQSFHTDCISISPPSHRAPTYHKKILPQSCGLWINPWIVGRLQIQCNPHTIQTDCSQMQQIGPGLDQIAAGLEPTQTGPGRDISSKPRQCRQRLLQPAGDCGGLGSLASDCDQNIGRAILTAVLTIQLNCDDIAKLRRVARGNTQIARKRPRLPQNLHPFAIGQGSECNPPKTVAMPAQSFSILGIVAKLHIPGDPVAIPFQTTREANRLQSNWIAELQRIAMSLT